MSHCITLFSTGHSKSLDVTLFYFIFYRPNSLDVEDEDYLLETTPGFRKHVSRKLSEIIDR